MSGQITAKALPEQDGPDYFRTLVRNCIETYRELPNDALCLDYNRVSGKLRAMVLDDAEYKLETRNIYAKQQLDALRGIEKLEKSAFDGAADDGDGFDYDPRGRGKKKKAFGADKDMLNIRRGIAQMKRDLLESLSENSNTAERDATNLLFVGMTREEAVLCGEQGEKGTEEAIYDKRSGGNLVSEDCLGWLGGPKRAPSDGPPGVKTIWIGLMKLYILLAYREYLA
jgi:hypothetical protein